MFSGVLGQNLPHRRMGFGAAVSVVLHVGVVAGVLWMTAQAPRAEEPEVDLGKIKWAQGGGGGAPQVALDPPRPKPERTQGKRPELSVPKVVPTQVATPADAPPDEVDTGDAVAGLEGVGNPLAVAGTGPGTGDGSGPGGGTGGPPAMDCGDEHNPCEYIPQMEKPVLLSGSKPQYTRDAALAGVEGTLVLSCVIDTDGSVDGCRTLRGLPHLEEEVRRALATQRYRPFRVNGQPVSVRYVFNFTFRMQR